jgi:hypothetical protein
MTERRPGFWVWVAENSITAIIILLIILGGVALICGYKEGVMSILTGVFGWLRGDDVNNKKRLADAHYAHVESMAAGMREQRALHDEEVAQSVENAKAECDEMDADELVDIGNAMLRERGLARGEA